MENRIKNRKAEGPLSVLERWNCSFTDTKALTERSGQRRDVRALWQQGAGRGELKAPASPVSLNKTVSVGFLFAYLLLETLKFLKTEIKPGGKRGNEYFSFRFFFFP